MSVSTPIGALRRDEEQDPNTRDMVEGIVRELDPQGLPGGGGGNYEYENMDYGAEYEQQMPQYPPQLQPQLQHPSFQQPQLQPQLQHQSFQQPSFQQQPDDDGTKSQLMKYVMNNLKEPMIAAGLYLAMSNDMISELISRYIPYAGAPISGLIIRSILIMGAFIILKMLLVKKL